VVHHGAAFRREGGDPALTEAVVSADFTSLPERLNALCGYALKLTIAPWAVRRADLDALRAAGLTDRDLVDANQVISCFNYVNCVADGLGVELEDNWPEEEKRPRDYPARRNSRPG
jgi:uncharacterized peroxidase-related enzyme